MRLPSRQICPARAFTLIEVMVAILIAAVVLASLNSFFAGAMRLRSRVTETAEQDLPVEFAVATMKKDLRGIVPPGTLAGAMASDVAAVGMTQPAALEIYTTTGVLRDDVPWADVQKIDYYLQTSTNKLVATGRDLIRGVTRNLLASTPETPSPQPLLQGVDSLTFAFYDGTNWNTSWSATLSNTPVAIRVNINFAPPPGGGHLTPPVEFVEPVVIEALTNETDYSN